MKTKFNNREIFLNYSSSSRCLDDIGFLKTDVNGEGSTIIDSNKQFPDAYEGANQEAHSYLLKNAMSKESRRSKLKKISILQGVRGSPSNDNTQIKIILDGITLFTKP